MHLKFGNLKLFDTQKNETAGLLFATRPFADIVFSQQFMHVEKTWLIDEVAGTSEFVGETELIKITCRQGFAECVFRMV